MFYTDGLSEARRGPVMFEDGELRHVLAAARGGSASEIAAMLEEAAVAFSEGATDDLAIVVVRAQD